MGKFGAIAILLLVAAVIYILNPSSEVKKTQPETVLPTPAAPAASNVITAEKPQADNRSNHRSDNNHIHKHSETDKLTEIPQFIKESLEAKRIPASELVEKHHPDGSVSMDLKGQFQHVPVAIMGNDGKVTIIETQIEPIPE